MSRRELAAAGLLLAVMLLVTGGALVRLMSQ
jgi:hypothetical protein